MAVTCTPYTLTLQKATNVNIVDLQFENQTDNLGLSILIKICRSLTIVRMYTPHYVAIFESHGVRSHDRTEERPRRLKIERGEAVVMDNKRVQWSYASNTHERERVHAQIEIQIKQLLFFKHGSPFKNTLGWADFEIIITNRFPTVKTLHTGRFAIPHELATASAARKPAQEIQKRSGQSCCI